MPIVVSSPGPDLGPVTLADVRAHLNIPATDTSQDTELVGFLNAAVEIVSEYVGAPLAPTTLTERYDRAGTIVLRASQVVSLTSVLDSAGAGVTGYLLESGGLIRTTGYGYGGRVTVTYVAGFATLPPSVRLAVLAVTDLLWKTQRGAADLPTNGDGEVFTPSLTQDRVQAVLASILPKYARGSRVA